MRIKDLWYMLPTSEDDYDDMYIKVNYAGMETYAFFDFAPSGDIEVHLVNDKDSASTVGKLDVLCGYAKTFNNRVRMRSGKEVRVKQTSYSETDNILTLYLKEERAWKRS